MLVAVVGPSGAGKDTLMAAARASLADDPRFVFIRRCITRPAEMGGEAHAALTEAAFSAARDGGAFALWWAAHGLHYGVPATMVDDLAAGRVVVANLSRGVLQAAAARFPLRVLCITAPIPLLAARLAARGRESRSQIANRVAREIALPSGLDVVTVMNDGSVQDGADAVVELLNRAASGAAPGGFGRVARSG